jgi:cytoskeletal protein RodZ
MKSRAVLLALIVLISGTLMACGGSSQAKQDAAATQIAAAVFATQTAEAPVSTPTSTPTPTSSPTSTATSTSTSTATPTPTPSPTDTPTITPTPEPVTIHIAPDGSGDYPSLEGAVAVVPHDSTIVLDPGAHHLFRPLAVNKPFRGWGLRDSLQRRRPLRR